MRRKTKWQGCLFYVALQRQGHFSLTWSDKFGTLIVGRAWKGYVRQF